MIANRIKNVPEYLSSCPEIKGLSEIHIFFTPICPRPQTVKKFEEICDLITKSRSSEPGIRPIKPCHLSLNFKNIGDLRVMQSSRYIMSQDMYHVIKECNDEADKMQQMFDDAYNSGEIDEKVSVIREKIEAIASAQGVPCTDTDAQKFSRYFEFHIKLKRKNSESNDEITEQEIIELKELANILSDKYQRPVPLSFVNNCIHQRYLNVRFETLGSESARKIVAEIEQSINNTHNFCWDKTISEYVWFDSYRALDSGWIDF
jgi:hypothetical protein